MKKLILFIMIISIILTTGCWDMVEINKRLFPYTIGIDINPGEGDKYIITISYPNIYAVGKSATQEERIHIVSTVATSIFQGSRQLSTRLQYPFYFKHLKVIVLGHELSKDAKAVREIIDGISRDFIINKKVRVVATEGMAKDLLLSIPKAKRQEVIEGTLYSMLQDGNKTSRYTPQSLTEFIRDTDMDGVSIMPRAMFHGEDLKIFGACIFKDYEFIGHLGELENRSIALIEGKVKEDIIDAPFKEASISYSISGAKVKKELVKDSENIKIRINMELEGMLREYIQEDSPKMRNAELLHEMEDAIEKVLQKEIRDTIEKLQKEFQADALGIAEFLSKFHPKVWKEVYKDWDEIFPEIEIETPIKVNIRRRGLVQ